LRLQFDKWTVDDGLPQNTVIALTQTRDGYLWLATSDGLVRFDGRRFKVFNRGNTPGMASNRLLSLREDRGGTLWIGGELGILMRYRNGEVTSYGVKDGIPEDNIIHIDEDTDGYLWLTGRVFSIARWRDGEIKVYNPKELLPGRIGHLKADDKSWWSVDEKGLHLFSRGRILTYTKEDGLPTLEVRAIYPDQRDTIWLTTKAGLVRLSEGRMRVFTVADGLSNNDIGGYVGEDRKGRLWFGGGVIAVLSDGATTTFPPHRATSFYFYEDRENTIWIGDAEGLIRVREPGIEMLLLREGRIKDWAYAIREDRVGAVWVGLWGGGLFRYQGGRFTNYLPSDQPGLFSERVTALLEDRAGRIWVGTEGGVGRFENGRLMPFQGDRDLRDTWAIHEDRAGDFWFGTANGLKRMSSGVFTSYTTREGLPHNHIKAILETRTGALWIGTYDGVARFENGGLTTFATFGGAPSGQIRSLYEDDEGTIWIGSYDNGLTRWKGGRFTRYTTSEGLYDNGVFHILEDDRGYLWMSCNRGIYRVSKKVLDDFAEGRARTIASTNFGKQDGMLNLECNGGRQPSGWKTRDGRLLFPTMEGVAVIDPARFPINSLPPGVEIEGCRVNQRPVKFGEDLTIVPGEDYIEIDYTGISFVRSDQVRFRHRLSGWDTDWIEAGNRRTAYYNYIAPGEYVFTVLAANSDGVWNERGRSLRIIVKPRVWQTWWFWSLVAAGAIGAMIGIYRWRVSQLERVHTMRQEHQAQLHGVEEEYSRQLVANQEALSGRIQRELHDVLKADLNNINQAALRALNNTEDREKVEKELDGISQRAAEANELVMEIMRELRPPILEAGLTEALKYIVESAASPSTRFIDEIGEIDCVLPAKMEIHLYRIVDQTVANVLKHAQASEATVVARKEDQQLLVQIQDNGKGFDPQSIISGVAKKRSFGLTSMTKRAQLLGGKAEIDSAPRRGTTITISIPLAKEPHDK
jgi:ligand-binding sensor domain-containing protein/signal transduction histidine kinase